MKLMVVGCGGVGESIIKIMKERDPQGSWLEKVVMADYDLGKARDIAEEISDPRFVPEKVNAKSKQELVALIEKHKIDFVMDAALPFLTNTIFDAALEGGANYSNMGVWTVPEDEPKCYGTGKQCFKEFMADYNFNKNKEWEEKGQLAIIGLGIEPGTIDVFARFAADHLFDELHTIDIKDGANMEDPNGGADDVAFGFNVWTVLDECMNPNITWYDDKGYVCDEPFAGEEVFEFPDGVGPVKLYKIEHEETVFMPRVLKEKGLKRVSYKIGLDDNLVSALKAANALGLRSTEPVEMNGTLISPRDLVAKVAPQPDSIDDHVFGKTCGGILCEGIKDGKQRKIFMYQSTDQQESLKRFGTQAVVSQTGFGASIGIELVGRGIWTGKGVQTPECFDAVPYLKIMQEANFPFGIVEYESEYKAEKDQKDLQALFEAL
ncbi:MAG: saccharopine dehydrogenase NADP-binding domain-containing protein [Clostridiales Family XIII bacterium]|nr:saccharopine dehydrogenase NADP-binding domain-containing protein [Clostridia bacterium]MDY3009988.1 saccharopine dehydrogenase NADP-binding domain-containing protein [Clostridiales Family XIII bacterium]